MKELPAAASFEPGSTRESRFEARFWTLKGEARKGERNSLWPLRRAGQRHRAVELFGQRYRVIVAA